MEAFAFEGAAIGGSCGDDFKVRINISGGFIEAEADHGAAIGAGNCANLKGDVTISGYSVIRGHSIFGAGMGGGCEGFWGEGGEVDATITISSCGSIRLSVESGDTGRESQKTVAIGHGECGSDNGKLVLGDNLRVNSVTSDKRGSECHSVRFLEINPCDHKDKNLTFDENTHTYTCKYCKAFRIHSKNIKLYEIYFIGIITHFTPFFERH